MRFLGLEPGKSLLQRTILFPHNDRGPAGPQLPAGEVAVLRHLANIEAPPERSDEEVNALVEAFLAKPRQPGRGVGEVPAREVIQALVQKRPGIQKSRLADVLDFDRRAVDHHVERLEAGGAVLLHRAGRSVHVFPKSTTQEQRRWIAVLVQPPRPALLQVLRSCEGLPLGALSARVGLSRQLVRYHLCNLVAEGVVHRDSPYRPVYRIKPAAARWLAYVLPDMGEATDTLPAIGRYDSGARMHTSA